MKQYRDKELVINFNGVYEYNEPCWLTYWDLDNHRVYTEGNSDADVCGWRDFTDEEWSKILDNIPTEPVKSYQLISDAIGYGTITEVI